MPFCCKGRDGSGRSQRGAAVTLLRTCVLIPGCGGTSQSVARAAAVQPADGAALPGLGRLTDLVRSVETPEFAGITFHEVLARSALNKVPGAARVPFEWTVNPYRGCSHACTYCFARQDAQLPRPRHRRRLRHARSWSRSTSSSVLRRELARPSWRRDPVALGTNTDPYQRAEGRYRLMPGIIRRTGRVRHPVLDPDQGHHDASRPAAADRAGRPRCRSSARVSRSRCVDETLHRALEPGTPSPRARLRPGPRDRRAPDCPARSWWPRCCR